MSQNLDYFGYNQNPSQSVNSLPPPSTQGFDKKKKVFQTINFHNPSIFFSELFRKRRAEKLPELPKTTQTGSSQSKTIFLLRPVSL